MKLSVQQKQWNRLARDDPFWAIITDPEKRHRAWDTEQFFATGREEIASAMQYAETLGFPAERARALDFGCGAGRLTQALTHWYGHVTGVDISSAMIDLARKHNRAGDRCTYVLNTAGHLRQFEDNSFDLIYSRMALQHVPARHARRYVREFVRVLRPAGLVLIQLPSRLRSPSALSRFGYRINLWVRRGILRTPDLLEMHGVPRETVVRDIEQCGARVLDVKEDNCAGPEWESWLYAITRLPQDSPGPA